jgi:hypothetical protein
MHPEDASGLNVRTRIAAFCKADIRALQRGADRIAA